MSECLSGPEHDTVVCDGLQSKHGEKKVDTGFFVSQRTVNLIRMWIVAEEPCQRMNSNFQRVCVCARTHIHTHTHTHTHTHSTVY